MNLARMQEKPHAVWVPATLGSYNFEGYGYNIHVQRVEPRGPYYQADVWDWGHRTHLYNVGGFTSMKDAKRHAIAWVKADAARLRAGGQPGEGIAKRTPKRSELPAPSPLRREWARWAVGGKRRRGGKRRAASGAALVKAAKALKAAWR